MRFSILVPARNEEAFLPACLESIRAAATHCPDEVEVIVALNRCTDRTEEIAQTLGAVLVRDDSRNLARIRNVAARAAQGEIIVTIDADSRMSDNMLTEVDRLLTTGKYVGGGVSVWPQRWSLGIAASAVMLSVVMLWHRVSGGMFWCLRKDFEAMGGFDERWVSAEDMDFAKRLKAYGRQQGKRFKTILRAHIVTSCRKFDQFGDWYLIRHPGFVWRIFRGTSRRDADAFYYDVKR